MVHKIKDLKSNVHNDWCPGCGDFGILNAIQLALTETEHETNNFAIFSGIGCSGKLPHYINAYGIHTLHGRVLPYAMGAKLANPKLKVLAIGGDGDGLGIGASHFIHAGRRNVDFTYIMHNNGVYGLTKGQASPTLKLDVKTKSLPEPNINSSINPISLALTVGVTFIARSYAYDIRHLKEIIKRAIEHKGFAFIDVLQPCPTYNNINTKAWYSGEDRLDPVTKKARSRIYKIEEQGFDPVIRTGMTKEQIQNKKFEVVKIAEEWGDKIPIGVFYQNELVTNYESRIERRIPTYYQRPPALQKIQDDNGMSNTDLTEIFEDFKV